MGRYAQAKRRGGRPGPRSALGPPPAPTLLFEGDQLTQRATGADDAGGQIELWYSADGEVPYEIQNTLPWHTPHGWGTSQTLLPGFYLARELGGGHNYAGRSTASPAIEV